MKKLIVVLTALCAFMVKPGYAATCAEIEQSAKEVEFSPMWGKVIRDGRTSFYDAPDKNCKRKGAFLIKGDEMTVYSSSNGFYSVMFVNSKTGEDFEGWMPESAIKLIGPLHRDLTE